MKTSPGKKVFVFLLGFFRGLIFVRDIDRVTMMGLSIIYPKKIPIIYFQSQI